MLCFKTVIALLLRKCPHRELCYFRHNVARPASIHDYQDGEKSPTGAFGWGRDP